MNRSVKDILRENGAVITHRSPGTRDLEKNTLFNYFLHGSEHFTTPEDFVARWKKISAYDFSAKELANIIQKTKHYLQDERFDDIRNDFYAAIAAHWGIFEESAKEILPCCNTQNLAMILLSAETFHIHPGQNFMDRFFDRLNQVFSGIEPQHLSNILLACAGLATPLPPDLHEEYITAIENNLSDCNEQNLRNTAWAAAALHAITNDPFYRDIFDILKPAIKKLDIAQLGIAGRKQIFDSFTWFDERDIPVKNPVREELESLLEKNIKNRLRQLEFKIDDKQSPIPGLNQAIDFILYAFQKPAIPLLMEIDGPYHENHNTDDPATILVEGHTLFRTAFCHKLAPDQTIVRVSHHFGDKWLDESHNPKWQKAQIYNIAAAVEQSGPGAYHVTLNDTGDGAMIQPVPIFAMREKSNKTQARRDTAPHRGAGQHGSQAAAFTPL